MLTKSGAVSLALHLGIAGLIYLGMARGRPQNLIYEAQLSEVQVRADDTGVKNLSGHRTAQMTIDIYTLLGK